MDLLNIIEKTDKTGDDIIMENTRPRLNTSRIQRRRTNDSRDNIFLIRTFRQLAVCGIIVALVFTISKSEAQACKNIITSIKNTLIYTVDYKATTLSIIENIKAIPNLFNSDNQTSDPVNENTVNDDTNINTDTDTNTDTNTNIIGNADNQTTTDNAEDNADAKDD